MLIVVVDVKLGQIPVSHFVSLMVVDFPLEPSLLLRCSLLVVSVKTLTLLLVGDVLEPKLLLCTAVKFSWCNKDCVAFLRRFSSRFLI